MQIIKNYLFSDAQTSLDTVDLSKNENSTGVCFFSFVIVPAKLFNWDDADLKLIHKSPFIFIN